MNNTLVSVSELIGLCSYKEPVMLWTKAFGVRVGLDCECARVFVCMDVCVCECVFVCMDMCL